MDAPVNKLFNMYAGPGVLPPQAIEATTQALTNFANTGIGMMEVSHREEPVLELINESERLVCELLGVSPEEWCVLFCTGGATNQFSMVPMNLLGASQTAAYILTGVWSKKALAEAKKVGEAICVGTGADNNFRELPSIDALPDSCAYLHVTSNNTIIGTQWAKLPSPSNGVPLVVDASSDFLSRPLDLSKVGLVYASAQKNLGPAGVTIVLTRRPLLDSAPNDLPIMLDYRTYRDHNSVYNTPPVLPIFVVREVLRWIKAEGGLTAMAERAEQRAQLVYQALDRHPTIFRPHAAADARSKMNLTFRLDTVEREKKFLHAARAAGFVGLAGHRLVGGVRVTMYNAFPVSAAEKFASFVDEFAGGEGGKR